MPPKTSNRGQETIEETAARLEMIVRQIYYIAKDAELYGVADYNTLKAFTDSLLYSALEYEKRIKRNCKHQPTQRPIVHGNAAMYTKRLEESLKEQYENLRRSCNERIRKA